MAYSGDWPGFNSVQLVSIVSTVMPIREWWPNVRGGGELKVLHTISSPSLSIYLMQIRG